MYQRCYRILNGLLASSLILASLEMTVFAEGTKTVPLSQSLSPVYASPADPAASGQIPASQTPAQSEQEPTQNQSQVPMLSPAPLTQSPPVYKPVISLPPLQGYHSSRLRPTADNSFGSEANTNLNTTPLSTTPITGPVGSANNRLPLPEKPPAELMQPLTQKAVDAYGQFKSLPTKKTPEPPTSVVQNDAKKEAPSNQSVGVQTLTQSLETGKTQSSQQVKKSTRTTSSASTLPSQRQREALQAATKTPAKNYTKPAAKLPVESTVVESPSTESTLTINASSHKVPSGTFLKVAFNTAMDSKITNKGEPFTAILTHDFNTTDEFGHSKTILPAGTFIRGWVDNVKRPTFLSRGGSIFLAFDHIAMPDGTLLPVDLKLSTVNTIVNREQALYSDPGIPTKLKKSVDSGFSVAGKITQAGVDAGKQNGASIVTVPVAAVGGVLAGAAVATGKSAASVFGKGETVVIKPGDTMTIDFGGSFNLPSE